MLYGILHGFLMHPNLFLVIVSMVMAVFYAIWLYRGFRLAQRQYFSIVPCLTFSFAALLDYLCVIELFRRYRYFHSYFLGRFLDGGFEHHPFLFSSFFFTTFLIGVLICIAESSSVKEIWKTFQISTTMGAILGILLALLFLGICWFIIACFLIFIFIVYVIPFA